MAETPAPPATDPAKTAVPTLTVAGAPLTPPASAESEVEVEKVNKAQQAKEAMKRRAQAMLKSDTSDRLAGTLKQINSPDGPSRTMARLFLFSLLGIAFTVAAALRYFNSEPVHVIRKSEDDHVAEFIAKQDSANKEVKLENFFLGNFKVELKPPVGQDKPAYGVMNIVEFDLVVGCDSEDTVTYLQTHSPQTRNQLTNALVNLTRDDFMTLDGKKRIKKLVMKAINDWLPSGKVEDVYLPKLVIN